MNILLVYVRVCVCVRAHTWAHTVCQSSQDSTPSGEGIAQCTKADIPGDIIEIVSLKLKQSSL